MFYSLAPLYHHIRSLYILIANFLVIMSPSPMDMGTWRFNLCASNTEPLLRLNVESRGDCQLCMDKAEEIIRAITGGDSH